MLTFTTNINDSIRVFSPYEAGVEVTKKYEQVTDLQCDQSQDDVTWFSIRGLTPSERRAATAMAPALPEDSEADRVRTAWLLELHKSYLCFGLQGCEDENWKAKKTSQFLGCRHFSLADIDQIPEETQIWLGFAVYSLSHPKP